MSVVYQFTVSLAKRNGSALSAVHIIENLIGAGWSLYSEEHKIIYTDVGDEEDYDYIAGSLDRGTYYKIVHQKQQRGEPIAFAMFYTEAGCRYRMDFIILASNESSGCLKPTKGWFGHIDDCREGQISSQLAVKYLTDEGMIVEGYSFEKY